MKNIFYLLVAVSVIFSSCESDSNGSLEPNNGTDIYGCTDPAAMNYNSLANSNDGSCLFAYDIAQGVWNITPDCDEIEIPILGTISLNEQMPETIDVQGNGDDSLSIEMNGSQVVGDIDNQGVVTVNEQTISIDYSGFSIPVLVSGTGQIESEGSGYMSLIYSGEIDFIPNVPIPVPFSATCHLVLTK